jgi:pheromone shutdown-related protein TraB
MTDSQNVTRLEYEGKEILLVGTAHVSRKSVEEVEAVISTEKPDTVCVELDQTRYDTMVDEDRWRKLDIFQIIKQKKVLFMMASLVLGAYQRKMGAALGVKPGAELLAAVNTAKAENAELILADRDIQATLKRTWANLSFWNKNKMLGALVGAFFASNEISEEQIEELKDRDNINEMMREFARVMPQVQEPLIDERDRYLMSMIQDAPGKKIVGVVGAAHIEGMVGYLGQKVDLEALAVIPPPSKVVAALKWVIPILVLALFAYGYSKHSGEEFVYMLYAWIIPNCVLAGIAAIIARAKVLTVIVSIIASPITSLNPALGAGMVAGLLEAYLRKPTVEDCEHINDDGLSLKGFYRNPFLHVLLVAVLVTFGSALGGWVGGALVGWVGLSSG